MSVRVLNIEAKHERSVINLAGLADFSVTPGAEVDAEVVVSSPNISLYCLDDATQQAIFVELPPDVDLSTAPFVYQMQYENATRLLAMPYETFREVAHKLPKVQHLILVFSVARSGSTLLSHVLNAADGVLSLSEPDAASQFIYMRPADGSREAELGDLLDCTIRMLCKPSAFKTPTTYAIKFRAEATQVMDLYHAVFPQAKILFTYRDTVGVVASFYRLFKTVQYPETMPINEFVAGFSGPILRLDSTRISAYLPQGSTDISLIQQLTLAWMVYIEWYLEQYGRGIPVLAVNYAELNARREAVLTAVFQYCGLPTAQVKETLRVFEQDSQAGTALAREKPTEGNTLRLNDAQIAEISAVLQQHPIIRAPDFIAPGTL